MKNLLVLLFFILCFNIMAGHRSNTYTASESITLIDAFTVNTSSASMTVDAAFSKDVTIGSTLYLTQTPSTVASQSLVLSLVGGEVVLSPVSASGGVSLDNPTLTGTVTLQDVITQTATLEKVLGLNASNEIIYTENISELLPTAYLKDVKSTTTAGGTFTKDIWQTRVLNTLNEDGGIDNDGSSFVTLSANQFTLGAGKYLIESYAPALRVNNHQSRLRDTVGGVNPLISMVAYSSSGASITTNSVMIGTIELTESTTFEIQHYCITTYATYGYGFSSDTGLSETYTQVKITKLK